MRKLLVSLPLLLAGALWAGEPLSYHISPGTFNGKPCLQVNVVFDGSASGLTYLAYQNNQFGEGNQMEFIHIPAQIPAVQVVKEPDSNRIAVRHLPGKRITVRYEVLDLQDSSLNFYNYCCYKPIIHNDYFHLQIGHLLAAPESYWKDPNDVQTVRLYWENFPDNWVLHNSFGPDKKQTVQLTNEAFNVAIFVGGDFRRYTFRVKDQPVYLLTRGAWTQFSDDTLVQLLRKTVEGHRSFWRDYSDSTYTVTFIPVDGAPWTEHSKMTSVGGSGLTNSFMSFATNNPGVNYDLIRYVWVHELMHRWIGGYIANAQEEKQYWFSEGFTEYFTLKNSLHYGFLDNEGFLKGLNDFSAEHYGSPLKSMPNDSMNYDHFWNGGKEWEKLPYRRGCLYAFYLDNYLRQHSNGEKGLEDLMRDILAKMKQNPGLKLDHALFIKMLRPYGGKQAVKAFRRYIEKGQPIDFQKTMLPSGMEVKVQDITMSFGPSKDVITKKEVLKDIPVFRKKAGVTEEALRAAILK